MSGQHTPGPFWLRTNTNGSHDVCGRYAKVVRSYPADQLALADKDVRALQSKFVADDKQLRDAAPELLEAAEKALNFIQNTEGELGITLDSGDMLRAAIAKARGAA